MMQEGESSNTTKNSELVDYHNNSLEKLNRWTIPSEKSNKIYNFGIFDIKSRLAIKTMEQTLRMSESTQTIQLLSKKDLSAYFKDYNFIHIGLIQIAFKPLTLLGMDASLMAYVRDARCRDFKPSLAAMIETSLCHGPVYFNVSPNLCLSLTDRNLGEALELNIHTHGYNFKAGSEIIAICYRIYYKVLNTLNPRVKTISFPGTTTLVQTNLLTTNVATNRLIKWEEITFPDTWSLPEANEPEPVLNQDIDQIVQTIEGDVEIRFTPQRISRIPRSVSSRSYASIPLAPSRASFSHLGSTREFIGPLPRNSTSQVDEDLETVQTIRISQNQIPHGIYQRRNPTLFEIPGGRNPTLSEMEFND